MAKQSGGFNRFLNFIGLVDDEPERDTRSDAYASDSYGRQSTYVPSRQRSGSNSNSSSARRSGNSSSSSRKSIPSQAGKSNYSTRRSSYDDGGSRYSSSSSTRRPSRFEEDYESDYDAPRSSSRSRFEEDDESLDRSMPVPASRNSTRSNPNANRTVMFSLKNLRDANMVITALVKGNTIVMTLNTDDPHETERIVDTLSGAVFALGATIRKASEQTYLLAPRSVNVKSAYEVEDQF